MNVFHGSPWPGFLLGLSLEAAGIAGAAFVVARLVRNPAVARRAWQAALVALLLLPIAEVGGLRDALRSRLPSPAPAASRGATSPVTPATDSPKVADESASVDPGATASQAVEARPVPRPPATPSMAWWPAALWLAGFSWVLARGLRSRHALATAARGSVAADDATSRMVGEIARDMALRRVHVVAWPGLETPVAFGVRRPTVAVPEDLAGRHGPEEQRAMLAHELAHLAGRDPAWMVLGEVACALWWWHPAAWWAMRGLRAACERTADAAAALVPGGRERLAEVLVRIGREWEASGLLPRLGIDGGRFRSELGRRVEALLQPGPGWRRPRRAEWLRPTAWALTALACVLFLPVPMPGGFGGGILAHVLAQAPAPAPMDAKASEPARTTPPEGTADAATVHAQTTVQTTVQEWRRSRSSGEVIAAAVRDGAAVVLETYVALVPVTGPDEVGLDWVFGKRVAENPALQRTNLPASRGYMDTWRSVGEVAVLTPEQFAALKERLLKVDGVELLATPKVMTLEGRAASVFVQNAVNVVTGLTATNGVAVGLTPQRQATNAPWWTLDISASVTSFVGYDDPGPFDKVQGADGTAVKAVTPIPVLRTLATEGRADLKLGSVMALRGPIQEQVTVKKGGFFSRPSTHTIRKRVFVFAAMGAPVNKVVLHEAPDSIRKTPARPWAATFSPDGNWLATTSGWDNPVEPGGLVVWNLAESKARWVWKQESAIRCAAFSPRGQWIAFGDFAGVVRVLDMATGELVREFPPLAKLVNSVAWTPDGRRLVIGGFDESVHVHDPTTGRSLLSRELGAGVTSVAVSADGQHVAATTWDGRVHWMEAAGLKPVGGAMETFAATTGEKGPRMAEWVFLAPDGRKAFTGNWDGTVQAWDVGREGWVKASGPLPLPAGVGPGVNQSLQGGALSPDGTRLAVGWSDGTVTTWDVATGRLEGEMRAHADRCMGLGFSPDGTRLATTGWDLKTRVWDVATRRRLSEW